MQSAYSILFLVLIAGAIVLSVRRPFAGLLIVAALSPFYSLLRESSVGSAVFFIWPYVLVGVLTGVMSARELSAWIVRRGATGRTRGLGTGIAFIVLIALGLIEAKTGLLRSLVTDASLRSMGAVLSSGGFLVLSFTGCLVLAVLFVLFPFIMRRVEGRFAVVDLAVAAFLLMGLVGIAVTYARNGLIFTGLNGFRYYFALAMTYLPARYFMRTREQEAAFLKVLAIACLIGAAQLLFESYLLNALRVPFASLPWAGALAREFGYQPEPRAFFEAPLMPVGFMYMTHVSGLFLLLGFAVAAPILLTRREDLKHRKLEIAVAAAAVMGGIWTSRTVLLLLGASFLIAAVLVPSSWRRRLAGAALLCGLSMVSAHWLIPGARYDLASEISFLAGRAVPNLIGAIAIDIGDIIGPRPSAEDNSKGLPEGWLFSSKGRTTRRATSPGRYAVDVAAQDNMDVRTRVPDLIVSKGDVLRAEVLVTTTPGTQVAVQVFDETGVISMSGHSPTAGTELVVVEAEHRGNPLHFDIDISAGGTATIQHVAFIGPQGTLGALGYDRPIWSPGQWRTMDPDGTAERVDMAGAPAVKLTAAAGELDFRYGLPPALLPLTGRITVTALVLAPAGQPVGLQLVRSGRVVDETHRRGTGELMTLEVSAQAGEGTTQVDIDVPPHGSALVHDVTVRTEQLTAALLHQPLVIERVATAAPGRADRGRSGQPAERTGPPSAAPVPPLPPAAGEIPPWAAIPPPAVPAVRSSEGVRAVLLGHGAEFGTWNQVFFASRTADEFATSSYSDTKYLEFFQQFGLLGLASLLLMGIAPLVPAARLWHAAPQPIDRAHITGLVLMVFIGFVSLMHLPSMFKIGFGTMVFIAMAVIARLDAERRGL